MLMRLGIQKDSGDPTPNEQCFKLKHLIVWMKHSTAGNWNKMTENPLKFQFLPSLGLECSFLFLT